jgi:hypothetical protein
VSPKLTGVRSGSYLNWLDALTTTLGYEDFWGFVMAGLIAIQVSRLKSDI